MTTMAIIPHFYFNQVDFAFSHGCSNDECRNGSISVGTEHTVIIDIGKPVGHDLPIRRYHPGCAPLHPIDPDAPLHPEGMESA